MIRGLIEETPCGRRMALRARHPPRPGDARAAARGGNPARLRGQRAGTSAWRRDARRPGGCVARSAPRRLARPRASERAAPKARAAARRRDRSLSRTASCRRDHAADILAAHDPAALEEGEHPDFPYRVMGRVTGKRGHGKVVFFDVRDVSGHDPGLRPARQARRGGLRADRRPRHRRHRRGRGRPLRDQTRRARDRASRPARCWRRR